MESAEQNNASIKSAWTFFAGARAALAFLTRIPCGKQPVSEAALAWVPAWFPVVGCMLGVGVDDGGAGGIEERHQNQASARAGSFWAGLVLMVAVAWKTPFTRSKTRTEADVRVVPSVTKTRPRSASTNTAPIE
jgi:hypothetical protein